MSVSNHRGTGAAEADRQVFDLAHLNDCSMQNQELAAEVVGLFLLQLPAILQAIETAESASGWAFATHTLKGSAAAIGAQKLRDLAAELEAMPFLGDCSVRSLRIRAVNAAASEFRRAARQAFPPAD